MPKRIYLTQAAVDMLDCDDHILTFAVILPTDKNTVPFEPAVGHCDSCRFFDPDNIPHDKHATCDGTIKDIGFSTPCPPDGSGYCWRHEARKESEHADPK